MSFYVVSCFSLTNPCLYWLCSKDNTKVNSLHHDGFSLKTISVFHLSFMNIESLSMSASN
jgi:hypothetical protein